MDYKKLLIISILLIAVAGLTVSTVSAKTYTKTVKFKDSTYAPVSKNIGQGDYLSVYYNSKYSGQFGKKRAIYITIFPKDFGNVDNPIYHYKITKVKIKFIKNVYGKTRTATKTCKLDRWSSVNTQAPIGWKPYSTTITYKDI